ncbi:HECT-like protein [Tanacetum coccineum]
MSLGLTFTWEVDELGSKRVVELLPDGEQISVNSINRNLYIDLIIEHQFVTSISQQVSQFSEGFVDIVGNEENKNLFFKSLEHEDLDRMLCGSESEISIVGEMSVEQRKALLFFWTSVKYLPVEGFCGLDLRLCITKSDETCDRLPSSHTCFYQLHIPAYPSMDVMKQRLNIIADEHVGCGFGI